MSNQLSDHIRIEVYQQDWIPGFGAFRDDGSLQEGAAAHVVINLGSLLTLVAKGDMDRSELPYFIAETLMHEIVHVLQSWAGVECSEERVYALIEKYEKHIRQQRKDGE